VVPSSNAAAAKFSNRSERGERELEMTLHSRPQPPFESASHHASRDPDAHLERAVVIVALGAERFLTRVLRLMRRQPS
jgi:hypothetical protein